MADYTPLVSVRWQFESALWLCKHGSRPCLTENSLTRRQTRSKKKTKNLPVTAGSDVLCPDDEIGKHTGMRGRR